MRCAAGANARSPSRTAVGGTPNARASAAAASALATLCGALGRTSPTVPSSCADSLPVRHEGTVDEQVVDDAEHRQRRCAEGEPDRAAALDDVGLLDHPQRHGVLDVVDGRLLRALVHARLGRDVGVHRAEVVDVVVGDVEADRRHRAHGVDERQLRRTDLDGDHVELVVHHDVDQGVPDVAGRDGAVAGRAQHRLEHQRRGRLAVRAGDAQPGRGAVGVAQAPGQLQLAPHRDPALERLDDHGRGRPQSG